MVEVRIAASVVTSHYSLDTKIRIEVRIAASVATTAAVQFGLVVFSCGQGQDQGLNLRRVITPASLFALLVFFEPSLAPFRPSL